MKSSIEVHHRFTFNDTFDNKIFRLLNETDTDIQVAWFTLRFTELFRHGSASDRDLFLTYLLEVFCSPKLIRLLCLIMANTLVSANKENFKKE